MPLAAVLIAEALGLTGTGLYAFVVLATLPTAQNILNYAARYQTAMPMTRDSVLPSALASPIIILVITAHLASSQAKRHKEKAPLFYLVLG